jgi:hypothetical protein
MDIAMIQRSIHSPQATASFVPALLVLCVGAVSTPLPAQTGQAKSPQTAAFATNCGNANAKVIFDGSKLDQGLYGVKKWAAVGDPDLIRIGNQWWMFFAAGPGPGRPVEYFSAYLPPGASLETSTTFPSDPKGWHILGAQADGQGSPVPVIPAPEKGGWDAAGAETATVTRGPDGDIVFYYSGYSASPYTGNPMKLGLLRNIRDGVGVPDARNPIMSSINEWENYPKGVGELLEPAVRYLPQQKKWVMIYTAGAWWGKPANNELTYADSSDGVHWEHRKPLGFGSPYYNADWLFNADKKRYEMTVAKDSTGKGGPTPRDIVWLSSTRPDAAKADWTGEVTLLQYNLPGGDFYKNGALSPAMQYGNLPGESKRLFVYFHSYSGGSQSIGMFYCDATQ